MIVKADAADLSAIATLNYLAYQEMSLRVPAWSEEGFFQSLVSKRAQQAAFYVIREDDTIIGSVAYAAPGRSVEPIPVAWASLLLLAVHPDYRGKGYGRMLASTCILLAQQDQAQTLGLFTSELMATAHRLYEGLGFTIDRELAPRLGLRYWLYRYDFSR